MFSKNSFRITIKSILGTLAIILLLTYASYESYFKGKILYQEQPEESISVFVASNNIKYNSNITEQDIALKSIPKSVYADSMINEKNFSVKDFVYNISKIDINKGDYITENMLYRSTEPNKEDVDGSRIVYIELDTLQRALCVKNDYVDILVKQNLKSPKIVLSKLQIQDIVDETGKTPDTQAGKRFVKMILSKKQTERLQAAKDIGQIYFQKYVYNDQKPIIEDFKIPEEYFTDLEIKKK